MPRLRSPERDQPGWEMMRLDDLLARDHRARLVWSFVEGLDLSELYGEIKAIEGRPGHPPADPRLLLGLWLYATTERVGSARALERLCREHHGFRWMCGRVSVNYHTLADFRVGHDALLDRLLTQSFAVLLHSGVATLGRVAQDGMRVRASAGAASFRRQRTLEQLEQIAQGEVRRLRQEIERDPSAGTKRQRKARERAAREHEARVRQALNMLAALERRAGKPPPPPDDPPPPAGTGSQKPAEPRASTTDAEARVMKMADGGFRPAFNVQFATETASQMIAGVAVGNVGSDQGQMGSMVEQLVERYGRAPTEMLVDGGFTKLADIEAVSAAGETIVYAPVTKPRDPTRDPHKARDTDPPKVAEWRVRMGTPDAKAIYKDRAATAECVNALARNRGLQRFTVRGLVKARAVALLYALAHNMMRASSLAATAT
jgi:transposase